MDELSSKTDVGKAFSAAMQSVFNLQPASEGVQRRYKIRINWNETILEWEVGQKWHGHVGKMSTSVKMNLHCNSKSWGEKCDQRWSRFCKTQSKYQIDIRLLEDRRRETKERNQHEPLCRLLQLYNQSTHLTVFWSAPSALKVWWRLGSGGDVLVLEVASWFWRWLQVRFLGGLTPAAPHCCSHSWILKSRIKTFLLRLTSVLKWITRIAQTDLSTLFWGGSEFDFYQPSVFTRCPSAARTHKAEVLDENVR